MKTKVSPAVVGLFVLGAFVLGLVSLLSFGGVNFFSKPQRFVVLFDESIHGLDLGSPVKLSGVRIGRVVDINLRYVPEGNRSVVAVVCELSRNVITDEKGVTIDVSTRAELDRLIDRGLRAQLGVIGLATGLLYVELDFYDPALYPPAKNALKDDRYAIMPATPSTISEFQASLTKILTEVKRIDFVGISNELKLLLADTRKQINTLNVQPLVVQWTATGKAVQDFVASPELKLAAGNINAAAVDLRGVLAKLDAQIEPAGTELTATLAEAKKAIASFNATAVTMQRFVNAQQGLGDEAAQTLAKLGAASEAVARLADFLERNPTALLTGRKPPE